MEIVNVMALMIVTYLARVAKSAAGFSEGQCCDALSAAGLAERVVYPNQAAYNESIHSYWSEIAQIAPNCIFQPHGAGEVAKAVKALVEVNRVQSCRFAIRGGGHVTWAGAAGIEEGVTIDLSLMNTSTYHPENKTVSVFSGARWKGVYEVTDKAGVRVAGGRASTVGAAGLVLGGGNSFYAAREGFVCDSVLNFEVVLASGDIVNANKDENPDLWKALKGSSGNFGIVTKFDIATIADEPGINLWGGVVTYPNSTTPQQLQALVNFGNNIHKDPAGSAIGIWQYTSQADATIVINAYDYTKPVVRPAVYDEFLLIPGNTSDSMRITNITDLTIELEQAAGYRDNFFTCTFKNDIRMFQKAIEIHNRFVDDIKSLGAQGNWTLQDMFQPLAPLFWEHSAGKGGNVLGLDRFNHNLVLWQTYVAWHGAEQDDLFNTKGLAYIAELNDYAKSINADNPYVYLNYAYETQDPLASYGTSNVATIRAVAKKYDPDGIFQILAPGGFKISRVTD